MSSEELKQRKQQRNKEYYTKTKFVDKPVVYVISGLQDEMKYVGVSNSFSRRQCQHQRLLGDVTITPVLMFKEKMDRTIMNHFECLIINYVVGYEKCMNELNKTMSFYSSESVAKYLATMREYLNFVEEEYRPVVLECLAKIEEAERGLNV